ncbi:MAG: cell division protein FtsZ [Spirochaetes bacterium]|nr:cell division protein FtsZ [Spirochaetota bacterium]
MQIDIYESNSACTRIIVIGIGGGGCNSINRMIDAGIKGVEFIAVNTDKQALSSCRATKKVAIGEKLTGGRGAGAIPEIGEKAAIESEDFLKENLKGANMVFITAGMGGGTGTGAAPIIARLAKELGCLTIGVVTKPFDFEKNIKGRIADDGIQKLKENIDTLIVISNQALLTSDANITLKEAWHRADDVLKQGVQGISDLIVNPGEINIDFADVQTVMKNRGQALMGVGVGRGENAAIEAVTMAIENPLMPDLVVDNARALLVNVAGSSKMPLKKYSEVMNFIENIAADDALVIPGQSFDDALEDSIKVTIVATGFDEIQQKEPIEATADQAEPEEDLLAENMESNVYSQEEFFKLLHSTTQGSQTPLEVPAYMRNINKRKQNEVDTEDDFLSKKN